MELHDPWLWLFVAESGVLIAVAMEWVSLRRKMKRLEWANASAFHKMVKYKSALTAAQVELQRDWR